MSKSKRASDRRRDREAALGDVTQVSPSDATAMTGIPKVTPSDDAEAAFAEAVAAQSFGDDEQLGHTRPGERAPAPASGGALLFLDQEAAEPLVLVETPAQLGRDPACDIVLDDEAVSKRHASLTFVAEDRMWVLEDTSSKNGTALNGARLEMPTVVSHGDVVQLGPRRLRFVAHETIPKLKADPSAGKKESTILTRAFASAPVRPNAQASKTPIIIAAAIAIALVAAVAITGGVWSYLAKTDTAQIDLQIDSLMRDAQRLFDQRKFELAKARVETVLSLDASHAKAKSLLRLIQSELDAKAALFEAQAGLDKKDFDAALRALGKIPDSSVFAKERDALRAQVDMARRTLQLDAIEALIAAGNLDEALAKLEEYLAQYPDDERALALEKRALKLKGQKPKVHPAVRRARKAFAVGNIKQARVLAEEGAKKGARQAARYVATLDLFERSLAAGRAAFKKKNDRASVRALDKAYRLASKLGGTKKTVTGRKIAGELADALYLQGVLEQQRGRACAWGRSILRAAALDGNDTKIAAQSRKVDKKARSGLALAEAKRGNKALSRQIAKEHLCFAKRGSKVERALKRLAR